MKVMAADCAELTYRSFPMKGEQTVGKEETGLIKVPGLLGVNVGT